MWAYGQLFNDINQREKISRNRPFKYITRIITLKEILQLCWVPSRLSMAMLLGLVLHSATVLAVNPGLNQGTGSNYGKPEPGVWGRGYVYMSSV
jgi:hypothetical protein